MGKSIHARNTPNGIRYREWSSVVDAYMTDEMTEEQLRIYLMDYYSPRDFEYDLPEREIPDRIARANKNGTSERGGGKRDLNGPWDTERCDDCGRFHHEFKPRQKDNLCSNCGELEVDTSHNPPCIKEQPVAQEQPSMDLLKELDEVIASEIASAEEIRLEEKDEDWANSRLQDANDLKKVRDLIAKHNYGEAQRQFFSLDTFVRDAMPLPLLRVLQAARMIGIEISLKSPEEVWISYRTEEIDEQIAELQQQIYELQKEKADLSITKGN